MLLSKYSVVQYRQCNVQPDQWNNIIVMQRHWRNIPRCNIDNVMLLSKYFAVQYTMSSWRNIPRYGSEKLLTKYTAILAMESYDKMYQNIPKCTKYITGAILAVRCYQRNIIRDTVEMFCCAMLTMRRHRRNIISAMNEILRVLLLMWNTIMGETFHVARNVDFLETLNPSFNDRININFRSIK